METLFSWLCMLSNRRGILSTHLYDIRNNGVWWGMGFFRENCWSLCWFVLNPQYCSYNLKHKMWRHCLGKSIWTCYEKIGINCHHSSQNNILWIHRLCIDPPAKISLMKLNSNTPKSVNKQNIGRPQNLRETLLDMNLDIQKNILKQELFDKT